MNKTDALETIKEAWDNDALSLGEKIIQISTAYYAAGLDISGTSAYIHTTESELNSLLELSEFDDDIIDAISRVNPPKTTWTVLSSASDEEVEHALELLDASKDPGRQRESSDEFVYYAMIEISGPTIEQKVGNLSSDNLRHALKKGEDFGALSDWDVKFLKSVAGQKRRGKVLSDKQVNSLIRILNKLADNDVIKHDSIDGDQDICDEILEALER